MFIAKYTTKRYSNIEAPNIEPYYRSLLDSFKGPLLRNPILIFEAPVIRWRGVRV